MRQLYVAYISKRRAHAKLIGNPLIEQLLKVTTCI